MKGGRLSPFVIDSSKGSKKFQEGRSKGEKLCRTRREERKKNLGYILTSVIVLLSIPPAWTTNF